MSMLVNPISVSILCKSSALNCLPFVLSNMCNEKHAAVKSPSLLSRSNISCTEKRNIINKDLYNDQKSCGHIQKIFAISFNR